VEFIRVLREFISRLRHAKDADDVGVPLDLLVQSFERFVLYSWPGQATDYWIPKDGANSHKHEFPTKWVENPHRQRITAEAGVSDRLPVKNPNRDRTGMQTDRVETESFILDLYSIELLRMGRFLRATVAAVLAGCFVVVLLCGMGLLTLPVDVLEKLSVSIPLAIITLFGEFLYHVIHRHWNHTR
jgi:hypothetical protein